MPKKPTGRRNSAPQPELSYIAEDLRPLAVPIDSLNLDPTNARTHDERNIGAIRSSIAQFGQRTPIVVNTNGNVIEKGNGTWQAMKAAGHSHIAIVKVEDDAKTQVGYSIADNRAGELARWDTEVLDAQLKELGETDFDIASIGFDEGELDAIIQTALPADDPAEKSSKRRDKNADTPAAENQEARLTDKFQILLECSDEQQQTELLERFQQEGLTCRAIIA